jgi:hypothetical protein
MSRWGIAALVLCLCFEAVFAGARDRDKDSDPPNFLDEVLDLSSGDCALNLLKVAGKQYKVLSSPLYRFLHQKLINEGKVHAEMDFLEIEEKRAASVGVDLADLERDRASVRRYLPGLLYDILLSRVAGFVGVAAGRRTGQTFDPYAAQDYFLSWQRPALHNILDFEGKLRLKISERLFPGFMSFKRLAAELTITGEDDERREEMLMDSLREALKNLKQFLLPDLYEYQIMECFSIGLSGRGQAERVFHKEHNYTSYTWQEDVFEKNIWVKKYRNLYYRRARAHDSRGPRVLMQTFAMPDTASGVAPLVSTSVDLEYGPLGVVLSLPEDLGQTLLEFVSRLNEVFASNAFWDPRADGP